MTSLKELYKIKINLETSSTKLDIYSSIIKKINGSIFGNNNVLFIPTRFNNVNLLQKDFLYELPNYMYSNIANMDSSKKIFVYFILYYSIFRKINSKKSITESLISFSLLESLTIISIEKNYLIIHPNNKEDSLRIPMKKYLSNNNIIEEYKLLFRMIYNKLDNELVIQNSNDDIYIARYKEKNYSYSDIIDIIELDNSISNRIEGIANKIREIKPTRNIIKGNNDYDFFWILFNLYLLGNTSELRHHHYVSSLLINGDVLGKGFGSFVFSSKNKFHSDESFFAEQFTHLIWSFFSVIELKTQISQTINHAIKSAIAAIMARNMSHNLGSHVLSYASVNLNHPFDMQVLLEYIQERMDFIAQITAEPPKWTMSMHFIGQLMRNFYKQRILLNYITKSEGLSAKEYNIDNNNNILQVIILDNKGNEIIPNGNNNSFEDPLVAIPGGITGAHAFYTILENIIRNAAKHSFNIEEDKGLIIYVQIDDSEDKYVTVKVYDNVTKNIKTGEKDDQRKDIMLFQKLEDKLKQALIEETGSLRYENWGLAEIKIGAGFLNKKEQDEIGKKIENINDLLIKPFDFEEDNNSYIGYKFNIPKPKYVLIILKDENSINRIKKEVEENKLENNGIYLKTYNDIKDEAKLDYEFILYQKDTEIESLKSKCSERIIEFEEIFINRKKIITINNCHATLNGKKIKVKDIKIVIKEIGILREILYKTWINCLLGKNEKVCLEVSPYENYSGGSSISNIEAYKYSVETLLKSFSKDNAAYEVFKDFLNKNTPDIANDLYKKLIKNDKTVISKLIDKKSTVVDMFKKYEEDIETLPNIFKESSGQESKELNKSVYKKYFDGEKLTKDKYDKNCKNANRNTLKIKYKRHASSKTNNEYYVEALSGSQSYFNQVADFVKNETKNIDVTNSDNIFAYSLIEAGLLDITVVDERVFEFYEGNPQIRERFNSVNIRVLKDLTKLKTDTKTNSKNILIIHQGIIDKVDKKKFQKTYTNLVNKYTYRYITSGSGDKKTENNNIPVLKEFKFIPFSNVRSALMRQYPEKYILIQSLMKI